jgi:hypothetical protein
MLAPSTEAAGGAEPGTVIGFELARRPAGRADGARRDGPRTPSRSIRSCP